MTDETTAATATANDGGGGDNDAPLTINDDPRFRQKNNDVDLRVQAQFADMWSPAEACAGGVLDIECPAVHRIGHLELPDAMTFQCESTADCNSYPCLDGQCLCGGTAVGTDCGSVRMLNFEFSHPGALVPAKTAGEEASGVPSLATFNRLLRGATPAEAIQGALSAFNLVQDPSQSEMDAKVQQKLKPELEFLLRATLETSPDGAVDLLPFAEQSLLTSLQATTWL